MTCPDLPISDIYLAGSVGFIVGIVVTIFAMLCFGIFMHEESPRPSDFQGYEG